MMKRKIFCAVLSILMLLVSACSAAPAAKSENPGRSYDAPLYSDEDAAGSNAPASAAASAQAEDSASYAPAESPEDACESTEDTGFSNVKDDWGEKTRAYPDTGNESYAYTPETGFKSAALNPLSTFSIDVDTASYSNIRRFLNNGELPPENAVRIEEMINYFHYNYTEPMGTVPFSVNSAVMPCPWNKENLLAVIGLEGRQVERTETPPSNLVFLIDVSGSMEDEDKLPLLKTAFSMLADDLSARDTVSIVTYSNEAGIALEPTRGDKKQQILHVIGALTSGGSTAGGQGIQMAYRLAEQNYIQNGNNRVILATDGDFNVGLSDTDELGDFISAKRKSGVFLSVLGFGQGNIKDDKMEMLADKGNGNYSYIDSISEAQKVLVAEKTGTLNAVAKDVKIQVEFNPATVKGYRLIGYENRAMANKDFANDKKDAGELGAGQTVTAIYEIAGAGGDYTAGADLKYQTNVLSGSDEWLTVHLRYKEPQGTQSLEVQKAVGKSAYTVRPEGDMVFAAAVAEFGLILKDSKYQSSANFKNVIALAKAGIGRDENGYRSEFIDLVKRGEKILN